MIWVSWELQIVTLSIFCPGVQHVLQITQRGGQQPVVVTVPKYSVIISQDPGTSFSLPKKNKQVLAIKSVCNCWEYCSLSTAVGHGEGWGQLSIPSDIGSLVGVDKDEESNEDRWEASSKHLPEEKAVKSKIKSLCHVHGAGENLRAIVQEVINSF